jgi:glycosyltransferase involved in cell wall biosynthesis
MPPVASLVSVVLPTYNRAHCLARAMQSVLAQTYAELELIVVDDGSSDGTEALVHGFSDPRLRYLRLPQNGGVSRARNAGVAAARGEWIAFQDSDDEWRVEKLARQMEAARSENVVLVSCGFVCANHYPISFLGVDDPAPVVDFTDMTLLRLPGCSTWLARKAALEQAGGFDPELNCFEDWELALRLSSAARVAFVNEPLLLYQKTPGSLFSNEAGQTRNLKLILQRHAARFAADPAVLAYYCNKVGQSEKQFGSGAEAAVWFRRAIAASPASLRGWLNFGVALLGRDAFSAYVGVARRLRGRWAAPVRPKLYHLPRPTMG